MDKVKEAEQRREIALIERDIRAINHVQTRYDRFNSGLRNTIIAIGGRTYFGTIVSLFTIPLMTITFYYWTKNDSYIPLLVGCGFEALILLSWIYRHQQIAKISAAGGSIEFDDPEVIPLNHTHPTNKNIQVPGRRSRIDTAFNEHLHEGEPSESLFKTDG